MIQKKYCLLQSFTTHHKYEKHIVNKHGVAFVLLLFNTKNKKNVTNEMVLIDKKAKRKRQ